MLKRCKQLCKRFTTSVSGVAAIEFAVIAPMLIVVLIESYDIGRAIAAYMKVRAATFTLASVTNQYGTGTYAIATTDMTAITGSAAAVLAPYTNSSTVVTITQIKMTTRTAATVNWSYSLNGTAYTVGSSWASKLPSQLKSSNTAACNSFPCYLIYAEVSYPYTPLLLSSFVSSFTMSDKLYMTPRSSACIMYNGVPTTC